MEENDVEFSVWLGNRLKELKTDEQVFGPYITSILVEGADDEEETMEALDGILGDLGVGTNAESFRNEILSKWNLYLNRPKTGTENQEELNPLGDQLDEILRLATETVESGTAKEKLEADPKLRAAILSTVAQSSDSEDNEGPSSSTRKKKGTEPDPDAEFGRNANVEKVLNEQRELKEKSRAESAKKKERDKDDRAKQKAAVQDRKDKAKKKATKVERKR